MGLFQRHPKPDATNEVVQESKNDVEVVTPPHQSTHRAAGGILPSHNNNGPHKWWTIKHEGESHRSGIHPLRFLWICFRSSSRVCMAVNVLWPVVPVAIAIYFAMPEHHLLIFILNYIAMVPAATLLGFVGQELSRKVPKVFGVVMETTLGSVIEIILFMVLLVTSGKKDRNNPEGRSLIPVIQAAILGSMLANMLLCLGLCFFVGGMRRHEQTFHDAISEVGSGLLLVAGLGLLVPSAFNAAIRGTTDDVKLDSNLLTISRVTAVLLLVAFFIYVWFQMSSHHGIYDEVLKADEARDADRHKDRVKQKLTLTECVLALVISLACVSMHATFLVFQIDTIVHDYHVGDAFMGLILVPIVEKAAEHLTAVDEAWDNQMNFALAHVLGATIQTALLNTPLVVIVGWGLGKAMTLNFEIFMIVILILSIIVVGNFLRDGKSNYLEGALCVIVYIIIAVATFYYPNPTTKASGAEEGSGAAEVAGEAVRRALAAL